MTDTQDTRVGGNGPRQFRLSFPDAKPSLAMVEIQGVLGDLTYLYDSVLLEHGQFNTSSTSFSQHPRRRLRTDPELALRITDIRYGSPFEIVILVPDLPDLVYVAYLEVLEVFGIGVVGGIGKAIGETITKKVIDKSRNEPPAKAPVDETPELPVEETPEPVEDEGVRGYPVSPDFLPNERGQGGGRDGDFMTPDDLEQGRQTVAQRILGVLGRADD